MRIFKSKNPVGRIRLIIHFFFLTVFTVGIFNISGCKEDPSILGRDLLPPGDAMTVRIDSSMVISAHTITGKNIITTSNNYFPIGSMKDSVFGFASAGIVSHYIPVSLLTAPSTIINVDSIVLTLGIAGSYGDSVSSQTVRVYDLNEKLRWDTLYYSDYDVSGKYSLDELGSASFTPQDSIITILLTNGDYQFSFIGNVDSIYENALNFVNKFEGLYIRTDNVTAGGGFTLIDLNSVSTSLDMYYNGISTGVASEKYTMYFASKTSRFNVYEHDYTSYPVSRNLDVEGSNDSVLFIEGLAGVSVKLKFPQIDTFLQNKKVAINKATLIVPVESISFGNIPESNYPDRLMLFQVKENGDYNYVYDFRLNDPYFGGTYDKVKKAFVFNLGLHLQSYLNPLNTNKPISDLVMVSYASNDSPNRVVLKGVGGTSSKIKLLVTYTEIIQ